MAGNVLSLRGLDMLTSLSVTEFLDELASGSPAPGAEAFERSPRPGCSTTSNGFRLTLGKKNMRMCNRD